MRAPGHNAPLIRFLISALYMFALEVHRLSADNRYWPIISQFADNRYRPFDNRHRPIIGAPRKQTYIVPKSKIKSRAHYAPEPAWGYTQR